jgi:hypothetical protein
MGFWLLDLEDDALSLDVNAWNWRPTVELLRSFDLLAEDEIECMEFTGGGGKASREEARAIGERIMALIETLEGGHRVMLDGQVETTLDDGTFHRDDLAMNYSASKEWLERFADFCAKCKGFRVI